MIASLPLYAFPLCMIVAAISDLKRFIIPNTISICLTVAFFITFAVSGLDWHILLNHVSTGVLTLLAGMLLWSLGVFGGGDAKLLAATGLWLGWPVFGTAIAVIAVIGGAMALLIILIRKVLYFFPQIAAKSLVLSKIASAEKPYLPYGVAIAMGSLYVCHESPLFTAFLTPDPH